MPTYDYKCEECGHEFEVVQRMTDDKITTCPECNQESVKRIITTSAGGFRIGGRGVHKPTSRIGH